MSQAINIPSSHFTIFILNMKQQQCSLSLVVNDSAPMLGTNELVNQNENKKARECRMNWITLGSDIFRCHICSFGVFFTGLTTRDEFTSARLELRVLESLILMLPWLFVWTMIWTSHKLVSHINLGGQNCIKYYILLFCLYSKHTLMYSYDSQFDQYIGIVEWFLPNIIIFG